MLEHISTRAVAARIRYNKLPAFSTGGLVRCACHPDVPNKARTEALSFWSKGDRIGCSVMPGKWVPALATHLKLGIVIDTRL